MLKDSLELGEESGFKKRCGKRRLGWGNWGKEKGGKASIQQIHPAVDSGRRNLEDKLVSLQERLCQRTAKECIPWESIGGREGEGLMRKGPDLVRKTRKMRRHWVKTREEFEDRDRRGGSKRGKESTWLRSKFNVS